MALQPTGLGAIAPFKAVNVDAFTEQAESEYIWTVAVQTALQVHEHVLVGPLFQAYIPAEIKLQAELVVVAAGTVEVAAAVVATLGVVAVEVVVGAAVVVVTVVGAAVEVVAPVVVATVVAAAPVVVGPVVGQAALEPVSATVPEIEVGSTAVWHLASE